MNRLMGIAGETLVGARWLEPFGEALQRLRQRQLEAVDLIEQTERCRFISEYRQHQSDRRHRLFSAREQQDILQTLARRLRDDLDAGLENVVILKQRHLPLTAAE